LEAYKITREKKKYVDMAITPEMRDLINTQRSGMTE
jgi:DNA replication licensing factor MCM7